MTVTTFTFDNPAAVVTWTVPNHTGTLTIEARVGDRVTFEGAVWESVIDANVWSPTAYPAGWMALAQAAGLA